MFVRFVVPGFAAVCAAGVSFAQQLAQPQASPASVPQMQAELPPPPATPPPLTEVLFKNLKARAIGPAVMGGRISDIAIDPRNPGVFFAGHAHGGVFKTNDNGVTF